MLVDLQDFFRQYAVEHPEQTVYECTVLDRIKNSYDVAIVEVCVPGLVLSEKTYELCRCEDLESGRWKLLVKANALKEMAGKYLTVSSYYKHGQTMIKLYNSEEDFRSAMLERIEDYRDYCDDCGHENMKTKRLIYSVLQLGKRLIEEQVDYGVVHVSRIDGEVTTFGMLD